jgi:hypothetical protein
VQDENEKTLTSNVFWIQAASAPDDIDYDSLNPKAMHSLIQVYPHDRQLKRRIADRYVSALKKQALARAIRDGMNDMEVQRMIWAAQERL